jgi:hypothetical protein
MSLSELRDWFDNSKDLDERLERVERFGTSLLFGETADELIAFNRAGPGESSLTKEELIQEYCREGSRTCLPPRSPKEGSSMPKENKGPSHYTEGRTIEPWDAIEDWGLDYCLGCAVKYISRCGRKGDSNDAIRDLEKAVAYLQRKITLLKGKK